MTPSLTSDPGMAAAEIRIKRAYKAPAPEDGRRILVDRLWPRGISKEKARIDFWPKELAPFTGLRRWYGHDPEKWEEFKSRYFDKPEKQPELLGQLLAYIRKGKVTLVFSSKELELNNAVALKAYIDTLEG